MQPQTWDAVCALSAHKLSLFPIPLGHKRPRISWKQYQTEHASREQLRRWFEGRPLNIGLVTGAVSGVVVVDSDSPEAESWARERLPETPWTVRTRKGWHRYFAHPGLPVQNKARLRDGNDVLSLDIRADGGFVLAFGSVHPTGHVYEAWGDWSMPKHSLPNFPTALLEHVESPAREPSATSARDIAPTEVARRARAYLLAIPGAIQGQGGDTHTFAVACKLVRGFGLDEGEALTLMQGYFNPRCDPPWRERDLAAKIRNAARYGVELVGGRL